MFKVVCLKYERTILTTDDQSKAKKQRDFHYRTTNHKTRVYEIKPEEKATGRELLEDNTVGNLILSDEILSDEEE